ncbi:MAG: hypothetical protein VR74_08665 [Hyphomonas sp. BRH_c22]|nr:MAG: hypothetical protein VR74_08665 [Hyphomonas sp. BRH_c22]
MDCQGLAFSPGIDHEGIPAKILDLSTDIVLAYDIYARVEIRDGAQVCLVPMRHVRDRLQPMIDKSSPLVVYRSANTTASIMPADNYVPDFEYLNGILQYGQKIDIPRWGKVGDIPVNEQLTRIQADNLVGRYAAIRAPDPEMLG